jgi:ankyrin repeat protein
MSIEKERMNRIDHKQELFEAVSENDLPDVRRRLSVVADVNAKDNDGFTPLHEASKMDHSHIVQAVLLEHVRSSYGRKRQLGRDAAALGELDGPHA